LPDFIHKGPVPRKESYRVGQPLCAVFTGQMEPST
jgi:hypothetical protein